MKTLLRIVLSLVAFAVLLGLIAYADGLSLPVNHVTTVTETIAAPPAAVFARILNVGNGAAWRHELKGVEVLPPSAGRDRWIEDLGHGQRMQFLAVETKQLPLRDERAVTDDARILARREVVLDQPGAAYGGTWTYEVAETRSNEGDIETLLTITESGYIHPPLYRFMMHHVFGLRKNILDYMKDMKASVAGG